MPVFLQNIIWFVLIRLFSEPEIIEISEWDVLRQRLEECKQRPIHKDPGAFAVFDLPEGSFNILLDKLANLEKYIRDNTLEKYPRCADFEVTQSYYRIYFSNGSRRYPPERIRHIVTTRISAIIMLFEKLTASTNDEYKIAFYRYRIEAAIEACLLILETFYHDK